MKWIIALLLALCMVTPAVAGQDPYISVVGQDSKANLFYVSPKYTQFLYDEGVFGVPGTTTFPCDPTKILPDPMACEKFKSQQPQIQPELCDLTGQGEFPPFVYRGNANAKVTGGNAGWYEWWIRLPKKPTGEINLVLQCGVVKPNAFALFDFEAVAICAAETGEWIGPNCSHDFVDPNVQPVKVLGLPMITAIAYPGLYNAFTPFNLTAFKNPGTYNLTFSTGIVNDAASQALDGTLNARILLKSCMDKTIVVKLPITGQVNAMSQTENDLVEGDLIYVKMNIPRGNTVDVYCHSQSLKVMGIGEAPF